MKDSSTGGLLAFVVAAPIVVICWVGKVALIGTVCFGTAGFLTGANVQIAALMAALGGIVFLTARSLKRTRRNNHEFQGNDQSERQTS